MKKRTAFSQEKSNIRIKNKNLIIFTKKMLKLLIYSLFIIL